MSCRINAQEGRIIFMDSLSLLTIENALDKLHKKYVKVECARWYVEQLWTQINTWWITQK